MSQHPPRGPLADKRILVVEDDWFIARDVVHSLTESGARAVGPVSNVGDALDLVGASPDLDGAVLDINLQGEWVFPVADVLKALGVPYVFATGYDAGNIPVAHAHARHFEKPARPEQIAEALFG